MSAKESPPADYGATRQTTTTTDEASSNEGSEKQLLTKKKPLKPLRRTKEEQATYENNIKDFLDALLSNTSLLAVSNIVNRKHPVLRTLWAIAFTVCLVMSIRQLYSLSRTFFSEPKSTVIRLSYKPFEYPLVTVCNHNPLRRSAVLSLGSPRLREFLEGLETKNYSVVDNGTQLMTQRLDWQRFHQLISNHSDEHRRLMGYQKSDFILQCNFGGRSCDPASFQWTLSKTYGNCFTFNAGQGRPVVAKNGREHGLIMTLYLELDEYLRSFIPSSGVKVHIHEPKSMASPEFSGFSVPPGFQTSIGVSLKKITRLDRPVGSCYNAGDFFGYKYTYSACMTACKHRRVQQQCGCFDGANRRLYNTAFQRCQTQRQLACMIDTMYKAEQGDIECDCRLPCEESHYSFKQSLSEWPTDSYETRLFGDLVDVKPAIAALRNESKGLARRNLLNLVVYVDGVMTEHVVEKSAYQLDSYLSDIGGTLGLFLGFSVLTGFELLEATALVLAYFGGRVVYAPEEEETVVFSRRGSQQIMTLHTSQSGQSAE